MSLFCTLLYFNNRHWHVFNFSWIASTSCSCARVSPTTCSAQPKSEALTLARSTRGQSLRTSVQLTSAYGAHVSSHTRDFQNLIRLVCDFVPRFYMKPGWRVAEGKEKFKERGQALFGAAPTTRHLTEAEILTSGALENKSLAVR